MPKVLLWKVSSICVQFVEFILLFSEAPEELAGVTGRDANEMATDVTDVNKEVLIGGDTQNNRSTF